MSRRKTNTDQVIMPLGSAPPVQPPGDVTTADASPEDMRKALRSLLGAFAHVYGASDGVRATAPAVYDFLAGVRAMTGATNLSPYIGKPGTIADADGPKIVRERLAALHAACSSQAQRSSRLASGFEQAAGALDHLRPVERK